MNQAIVGRHLWVGITGTELDDTNRRLLNTVQPGGVVLFARNVESAAQLRMLTRALKTEIRSHPVIAIDHEGGRVNRLRPIIGELPKIAEVKKAGKPEAAFDLGRGAGEALRDLGVDVDFAPVLDLELFDYGIDNGLRERCWGRTVEEVVRWAGAFIEGLQSAGVPACPKHFPGIGAARQDSHEQLPVITRSKEELLAEDVKVFQELLPSAGAVMVGHGRYPALDGKPASLSQTIITNLLRGQLGFKGLVVTDDLEMGAITSQQRIEEAAVEALSAGADMVLVCHTTEKVLAVHEALTRCEIELTTARERIRGFAEQWGCGRGSVRSEADR